jgi:flagellar basal body-associated protein FliL
LGLCVEVVQVRLALSLLLLLLLLLVVLVLVLVVLSLPLCKGRKAALEEKRQDTVELLLCS